MDRTTFLQRYWKYYCKLEQDCIDLSQYIEFRPVNLQTCSNVIIGQLLNVGAEFDHFCKIVCHLFSKNRPTITDYANYLLSEIPCLQNIQVHIQGSHLDLFPFKDWNIEHAGHLFWWYAYNNVKHDREHFYESCNLENLLNALAGLYFLEMYYAKEIAKSTGCQYALDVPISASSLFRIANWVTNFIVIGYNCYVDYEPGMDGLF